jgi:hypothetical protein
MGGPELQIIDPNGIFLADLFGLILSLPIALFLAFWMSDVKNRVVVVIGAFIGAFLSFLVILGWVGTLIYNTVLPGANPGSTFFGSLFLCSTLGLAGAVLTDVVVARMTRRDYRRSAVIAEE